MRATFVKCMFAASLAVALLVGTAAPASAQAIITIGAGDGSVALGVNEEGHLNLATGNVALNSSMTGVSYFLDSWGGYRDATSPGCFCEGWGVSASGSSGYANVSVDGVVNLTVDSFVSGASTAVSSVHLTSLAGLEVTHDYHPSTSTNLFAVDVTITNDTAGTLTDVRYVRVMDWDVPLTEFAEYVTLNGCAGAGSCAADPLGDLEYFSDEGFASANPLAGDPGSILAPANTNVIDSGVADHGAYFRFNFGDLLAGESKTFTIYYGAAADEASAFAALAAVGAEGIYSLGQSSTTDESPRLGTPATYIFGFGGVGAPPIGAIPEPASMLLLGTGLAGGLARRLRRKKA